MSFINKFSAILNKSKSVRTGITSLKDSIFSSIDNNSSFSNTTTLVYPEDLRDESANSPFIEFKLMDGPSVFFPCPPGISFSGSAEYSPIDLGIFGAGGIGQMTDMAKDALNDPSGFIDRVKQTGVQAGTPVSKILAQIAAKKVSDTAAARIKLETKITTAPNTNTLFSSVGLRSFSFSFRMVAKSKTEAQTVKSISEFFHRNLYPESLGADMLLSFPKPWIINFYSSDGQVNEWLPRIKRCNLTGVELMYNENTNVWHIDGAPMDVSVKLSFGEMKTLNRSDIENTKDNNYSIGD